MQDPQRPSTRIQEREELDRERLVSAGCEAPVCLSIFLYGCLVLLVAGTRVVAVTGIAWTHPSVRTLQEHAAGRDPVAAVEDRARDLVLSALEQGWSGPPFDPFELADRLKIELVARQDLDDARLVAALGGPRIEFNPARRPARVRFSIAHEIGHFLFPDYGERVRYRDAAERRGDDWQLEMLCNIAAAEFLMPIGAFPLSQADDLSLAHLLDQRRQPVLE